MASSKLSDRGMSRPVSRLTGRLGPRLSRLLGTALAATLIAFAPAHAIVGGSVDTTTECVGALHYPPGFACTGTLIAERWVLTTAACASTGLIDFAMGSELASLEARYYDVRGTILHPSWSGGDTYDFALLLLEPAAAGEPTCPAMTPAQDALAFGTPVVHAGYGLTSVPTGTTTQRHSVGNSLDSVTSIQLGVDLSTGGPCLGDEGGPTLDGAGRVAGVVTTVDEYCAFYGVSGRVSAVYDDFIAPTLASTPPTVPTTGAFGVLLLVLALISVGMVVARRLQDASGTE